MQRNGNGHEDHDHGSSGKHKHLTTGESGDDKSDDDSVQQTPALVGHVDARLCAVIGKTHQVEEQLLVVREQSITAHLGEQTQEDGDDDTAAHSRSSDHVHPGLLRVLHLELDRGSNLGHFSLDEERVGVVFSVVFDQNGIGLVVTVTGNQKTWALGKQPSHVSECRSGIEWYLTKPCKSAESKGRSAEAKEVASPSFHQWWLS